MAAKTVSSLQALRERGSSLQNKYTLNSGGGLSSYYESARKTRFSNSYSRGNLEEVDMTLPSSLAYEEGYYAHTYVANFQEAIQSLGLKGVIETTLSPVMTEINGKLSIMLDAVKPTEVDKEALEVLQKRGQSGVSEIFANLKRNYGNFKTGLSKIKKYTKKHMDEAKAKIQDEYDLINSPENLQFLREEIKNEVAKEWYSVSPIKYGEIKNILQSIFDIIDDLTLEEIIPYASAGNRLSGMQPDKISDKSKKRKDFITGNYAQGVARFLTLSKLLSAAAKYTNENIKTTKGEVNKSYSNALSALSFWDNISSGQDISLITLDSKNFTRYFGLSFEPVEAVLTGGTVVGHKNDPQKTATDLEIQFNQIIKELNKSEENIKLSLKTASLVYRTQTLQELQKSVSKDISEDLDVALRPIKYFLLNYGLLMEYQNISNKTGTGEFTDINLMSSTAVTEVYNYLCSSLGNYFFTNLIVGYILKNWTTNEKDLQNLPKIILNSQDRDYIFTADLIKNIQANTNKGGTALFIHPKIDGNMLSTYADLIESKHRAVAAIRKANPEKLSYEEILNTEGKVRGYYNQLSSMAEKMSFFTATDIAILAEKQGAI